jgi:mycothiol synthase
VTPKPDFDEPLEVIVRPVLSGDEIARLRELVAEVKQVDGASPLNEQAILKLRSGSPGVRHVLATVGDTLVGYVYVDTSDRTQDASAELVVRPAFRRHGLGAVLVQTAVDSVAPGSLRLWAHGHHPGAARLAASLGFSRVRDLWLMRRALDEPLPAPDEVPGITVRTFEPGRDEDAWLAVNTRAFAHHPEQGATTRADLEARMAEPWFDPGGFFLAERDGSLLGFHWTKVHRGDADVGEVYVVGVDPDAQGMGLGRLLTIVGLRHLQQLGLPAAILYVESDNAAAIRVYERLGFVHQSTDVMYLREDRDR